MFLLSIRSRSGHQNPAYYLVSFFFVLFDYVTAPVLRRQTRIIFLNPPCAIPHSLCPLFTSASSWTLLAPPDTLLAPSRPPLAVSEPSRALR
ncbi:hypothetical protein DFH29DRAFT_131108 [Suillus ampliporus]|nr:hypothetical protein DFH29DRAFT_131108 [Suillus ampliporus]